MKSLALVILVKKAFHMLQSSLGHTKIILLTSVAMMKKKYGTKVKTPME